MLIFLVSFALTEQQAEVNVEYLVSLQNQIKVHNFRVAGCWRDVLQSHHMQLLLTSNMHIVTLQVRAAN